MSIRTATRAIPPSSLCWRCQAHAENSLGNRSRILGGLHRRTSSTSTKSASQPPYYPSDTSKQYYIHLKNRTLIRLDGPDATDFLHNLIPAPILPLDGQSHILFSAFLNAKGRILYDVYIHKPTKDKPDRWVLDVDTNSAGTVMSHLKKHKLRSKFKLQRVESEEAGVFYVWPREGPQRQGLKEQSEIQKDPRPGMGYRIYSDSPSKTQETLKTDTSVQELGWQDYMIHRMLSGFAEGPVEIQSGAALPQESNLDFVGGVDFHKGCYLGQELTIRTHHTGVVRKRIIPVQIYADDSPIPADQTAPIYNSSISLPQPPHDANIAKCGARGRSGRSTGKWLGGYGNIGLALCRLETMTDLSLTAEGSQHDPVNDEFEVSWQDGEGEDSQKSVKVKAFVPPWLRQGIEETIKMRNDRSQARRKQADEEEEEDVD